MFRAAGFAPWYLLLNRSNTMDSRCRVSHWAGNQMRDKFFFEKSLNDNAHTHALSLLLTLYTYLADKKLFPSGRNTYEISYLKIMFSFYPLLYAVSKVEI